jgi:hypothetical protein
MYSKVSVSSDGIVCVKSSLQICSFLKLMLLLLEVLKSTFQRTAVKQYNIQHVQITN